MRIEMLYGKGTLAADLPAGCQPTLIGKPPMPLLERPGEALAKAFAEPVDCAPLRELAQEAHSACILICDITRPVPNGLILPPLIKTLLAAGMKPEAITVLVATGLHRPNEGAELAELVGDPFVLETVRVLNHDARNAADHGDLGRTTRGTPVKLDRRFLAADLKIVTGLVEPHFMAGYSGGRKVIAPGIAHRDTITVFHSARFMEHPRAANCVLEGNPLHEEQLEIVNMLGEVLAVNVVIDDQRRPAFINFGEVVQSHLKAVAFIRNFAEIPVPRKFPLVLTSAAGYPLDKTYYQTVKGMVGAMDILSPGGALIIASECSEGFGSPDFRLAQQRLARQGAEGFLAGILEKSHADIDEWQTEMQLKPMRVGQIHLVTRGLDEEERRLTGVRVWGELAAALEAALPSGGAATLAVIPEGPYVVPRYAALD